MELLPPIINFKFNGEIEPAPNNILNLSPIDLSNKPNNTVIVFRGEVYAMSASPQTEVGVYKVIGTRAKDNTGNIVIKTPETYYAKNGVIDETNFGLTLNVAGQVINPQITNTVITDPTVIVNLSCSITLYESPLDIILP